MARIVSRGGSVRGLEGSVDKMLNALKQKNERLSSSPLQKRIHEEEVPSEDGRKKGRVVLYITTIQAVRQTAELCRQVVQILRAYRINFTLKDVFLHPDYYRELCERMGTQDCSLPQLFIKGRHAGDGKGIVELNEEGTLKQLCKGFKRRSDEACPVCGGQEFITCLWCKGTKKGMTTSFGDLKCTVCNVNGLQKCPQCSL